MENQKTPTAREIYIKTVFPTLGVTQETEEWFELSSISPHVINAMERYKDISTDELTQQLEQLKAENDSLRHIVKCLCVLADVDWDTIKHALKRDNK